MAVLPNTTLRRVVDRHRREAALPADGLLVSKALAKLLEVAMGDTLELQLLVGRRRSFSMRLGATIDDLVGTTAYLPADMMRQVVGDEAIDGAVLRVAAQAMDTLYDRLKHTPGIAGVASRRAVVENFDRVMAESFNVTLLTMAIFALALSIGVIYNTARIALSERGRELASLRVLGFTRSEVARMLFGELGTLGLAAIPCGFLIGLSFCWLMATGLSSELFRLPRVVSLRTFGLAAGTLVSAGLCSALLVRHRLNRLDLVAALKTRE
jgi:putative ABC transport system permease protein